MSPGQSTCWNCGSLPLARFCAACGALQPPAADYFEFFGLPRALAIDRKDLEKRFYALSRQLHPDVFSRKSPKEQEYSLDSTAILNDGYRVLKDPVARAQYVLKQEGFNAAEQGTKDVPPELLEEVFELNMAIEEQSLPELAAACVKFGQMRDSLDGELRQHFATWDATRHPEILAQIRALLNRRKYIANLIDKASHVPDRI